MVATMISERTGAKILRLRSGQVVTDTQLREGVTYLSMAEENLENLKKALYEA
jgi:ABC-type Zn uptake system ZnuABC Zn-binding protein ZnuA